MAQHAVPLPQKMDRIKVLAAESTRMNSQLLAEALAQDCLLDVMGIEPKQAAILAAVAQHKPHVVLISSALEDSGTQGFDLARQISATCPGTRVILLMDNSHPASVVQAFRCGAHGIFSRTESSKSLAKCIHSVHQGQVWANSAELRYVIEALRESEPMRLHLVYATTCEARGWPARVRTKRPFARRLSDGYRGPSAFGSSVWPRVDTSRLRGLPLTALPCSCSANSC